MAKGRTDSAKYCTKRGETDVEVDGGGKREWWRVGSVVGWVPLGPGLDLGRVETEKDS